MREKIFRFLSICHSKHPWKMLILAFLVTLLSLFLASRLERTMRWSDLLPSDDPRTLEFDRIIKEFVSSSSVIVVVQGEEKEITAFAEAVVPLILELKDERGRPYCQRVNYKREMEFIRNNGLMMIKSDHLENIQDIFFAPSLPMFLGNLNNSLEKEYIGREESLSTREKEDRAVNFLEGIRFFLAILSQSLVEGGISRTDVTRAVEKILLGDPYVLSYDRKALILEVVPNFNMVEVERLVPGVDSIQQALDEVLADFPEVSAGLTGMPTIQHDEYIYTTQSLGYTSVIALVTIFILLALAFRMALAPAMAIANLVVGIIWAMGTAYLVVGNLNIMTSMTGVVLIGLGIDFAIHLISAFTEERSMQIEIEEAVFNSFAKCGRGIITGGFTTSAAFLTLSVSSSRGMREMGIIMGCGLLSVMTVTFLLLPSLLVLREMIREKGKGRAREKRDISFRGLGRISSFLSSSPRSVLILLLCISCVFAYFGSKLSFDQNYMNLEPKGLTSVELYDTILDKFDLSMDYSLFLTADPASSANLAELARSLPSVGMVEDISLYLPSEEEQEMRIEYVRNIMEKIGNASLSGVHSFGGMTMVLQELQRLEMNIMEMQDLAFLGGQDRVDAKCAEMVGYPEQADPYNIFTVFESVNDSAPSLNNGMSEFENYFAPLFRDIVLDMGSGGAISLDDLPVTILNRYANRERSSFLVTVYPVADIWKDALFLNRFVDDLERIDPRATGMPPIFRALMRTMGRDGRRAVMLTIGVVFLLLLFDFGKVRYAVVAMIPLAAGLVWMTGIMYLSGMKLTVINVMVLPLILGIGIDDGVYVMHRWLREGKGRLGQVFSSTGKAILLTSLTDMLAFGSLVFSIYRGFAGFGAAMFIGVGTCFAATIFILAPLLGIMEKGNTDTIE